SSGTGLTLLDNLVSDQAPDVSLGRETHEPATRCRWGEGRVRSPLVTDLLSCHLVIPRRVATQGRAIETQHANDRPPPVACRNRRPGVRTLLGVFDGLLERVDHLLSQLWLDLARPIRVAVLL